MGLFSSSRRRRRNRSLLGSLPIVRWFGPGLTLAGIVAAILAVVTGRIDLSGLDQYRGEAEPITLQPVSLQQLGQKSPDVIRIATFNIRVFGPAKMNNLPVMRRIAQVVSAFDIVAIQEVRGGDDAPVQKLVQIINQSHGSAEQPSPFRYLVGPPVGRTSQVESAAYVWNASRIRALPESAYLVQDGTPEENTDLMHREPFVASFETRIDQGETRAPFRFTLINVHTDPDEVSGRINELNVLDDVFNSVRSYEYARSGEEDFILLGDLNVDVDGLGELGRIPGMVSLAGNVKTNVIKTDTKDHILIDRNYTAEFIPRRAGVIDLVRDLGISTDEASDISDHLPVFAEFGAYELPNPAEQRPQMAGRGASGAASQR